MDLYITTYQGLEEVLLNELISIGYKEDNLQIRKRGISLRDAEIADVYKLNYALRTGIRVLVNLDNFRIKGIKDLQWKTRKINWHKWFDSSKTFRVDAVVNNSREFNNPKYASQVVKDGIVDCFKNTTGTRPDIYIHEPDVIIQVLISKDNVTLSMDSSGESLHKRGYKTGSFRAPMSEVLAAGILKLSGFEAGDNIYDPMCGSGTILTEAFMAACNIPAGRFRDSWVFQNWSTYSENDFLEVKEELDSKIVPFKGKIMGSDKIGNNVDITENNLRSVGCRDFNGEIKDFFDSQSSLENGLLIANPPYDKRMEIEESMEFYKHFGDTLKQGYKGWKAAVFSANIPALKHLGLKPKRRIPLFNGPLEGRLFLYELY